MNSSIEIPFDSATAVEWAHANALIGETVLMLVGVESRHELPDVLEEFRKLKIDCAGAIFSEIIVGTKTFKSGFLIQSLGCAISPVLLEGVDTIENVAWDLLPDEYEFNDGIVFLFADVACKHLGDFLHQLYGQLGNRCRYFGGGAGKHDGSLSPVFTTHQGIKSGAVVLGFAKTKGEFHGRHGWSRAASPVVATKAKGNLIQHLNGTQAFSVYSGMVEELTGHPLSEEQIYERGVQVPLGMSQEGMQDIVRCPIAISDDGELTTVGGVYPNSVLHILTSTEKDLTEAANLAAAACATKADFVGGTVFVLDCVSRFEKGKFQSELETIQNAMASVEPKTMVGALTMGEICSRPNEYPLWLNKVVAIGVFDF